MNTSSKTLENRVPWAQRLPESVAFTMRPGKGGRGEHGPETRAEQKGGKGGRRCRRGWGLARKLGTPDKPDSVHGTPSSCFFILRAQVDMHWPSSPCTLLINQVQYYSTSNSPLRSTPISPIAMATTSPSRPTRGGKSVLDPCNPWTQTRGWWRLGRRGGSRGGK